MGQVHSVRTPYSGDNGDAGGCYADYMRTRQQSRDSNASKEETRDTLARMAKLKQRNVKEG